MTATPGQPPTDPSEHAIQQTRWHGVAPMKLVWLTAGLVVTALVALSACSTLFPSSSADRSAAIGAAATEGPSNPATVGHESEPLIRVRIVRSGPIVTIGGPETVHIIGPNRPRIRAGGSGDDFDASSEVVPTPVTITVGLEAWRITDGRGNSRRMPRSAQGVDKDALRITSLSAAMLELDGKKLPGSLWLHGRSGSGDTGAIDVVEHLPIEVYLPGVIAKELYPNWKLETFKAQAIAARSYAMQERQRRLSIGSHFDLESTTQDQVYGGATTNPTALKAVELTYGRVLTWNGHLLRAYYSSTTAGRAASARDTWPTGPGFEFNLVPPIQASPRDDVDSFSPLFRWEVERDIDSLSRRVRSFAASRRMSMRSIERVAKIEPVSFNSFDRPQRYRITEEGGRWWELSAETTRLAVNHTGDSGLERPTRAQRVNSGDFTTRRDGNTLVFNGRGFGHGVGMSQFGAEGMARQGRTADEILMHYYPGAELQRAY